MPSRSDRASSALGRTYEGALHLADPRPLLPSVHHPNRLPLIFPSFIASAGSLHLDESLLRVEIIESAQLAARPGSQSPPSHQLQLSGSTGSLGDEFLRRHSSHDDEDDTRASYFPLADSESYDAGWQGTKTRDIASYRPLHLIEELLRFTPGTKTADTPELDEALWFNMQVQKQLPDIQTRYESDLGALARGRYQQTVVAQREGEKILFEVFQNGTKRTKKEFDKYKEKLARDMTESGSTRSGSGRMSTW